MSRLIFYCFSLPAAMVQSLLTEFLKITMEISPEAAKYTDLHFDILSEQAAFAAQLYHRWYDDKLFVCWKILHVFYRLLIYSKINFPFWNII